ncbi:MAG: phosphoribosylformylglycinamidine synthase subunit PurS, partial [Phycisphaerales bacterium JB061]
MSTSDTLAIASVHRIVVQKKPGAPDPEAQSLLREAEALGTKLTGAKTSRVYLLQAELTDEQLASITDELLVNPVLEVASSDESAEGVVVEVHPLPGVMDPVAQSVATAVEVLTGSRPAVQTAHRYELTGVTQDQAHALAERLLANTVVNHIHDGSYHPDSLPTGSDTAFELTHVPIRDLDDAALEVLSRDGHLFLDLHEMQAIRAKYQELGREPTDIELETLAQTWSEHCVHKTLKSTVHYTGPEVDTIDWSNRPGHVVNGDGSVTINNLLKSTVAAATFELIEEGLDWTLSVFVDNAGIIE